jgi:hypothetical protein
MLAILSNPQCSLYDSEQSCTSAEHVVGYTQQDKGPMVAIICGSHEEEQLDVNY